MRREWERESRSESISFWIQLHGSNLEMNSPRRQREMHLEISAHTWATLHYSDESISLYRIVRVLICSIFREKVNNSFIDDDDESQQRLDRHSTRLNYCEISGKSYECMRAAKLIYSGKKRVCNPKENKYLLMEIDFAFGSIICSWKITQL